MSADDGFLARWSRRKRSADARKRDPAAPQPPSAAREDSAAPVAPDASAAIASLPPIESLDANSDITPFLAPGVPAELTRRALRRAWHTDPAIRDFVGLSENAWDFNAPDGVPGFGALTPEDIRRLLDELAGTPEAADPPAMEPTPAPTGEGHPPGIAEIRAEMPAAAAQSEPDQPQPGAPVPVRRHGSALPQ